MFDRQRFIEDLKTLATKEVRWRHQGQSVETGMDCIGSLKWAYEQQGLRLPTELEKEFESYHRPPDGWHLLEVMRRHFIELTREEMEPSDLYVIYNRKNPCHLAVKLSSQEVAEAFESMDGSISRFLIRPLDPRYRIAACFRIPDFG